MEGIPGEGDCSKALMLTVCFPLYYYPWGIPSTDTFVTNFQYSSRMLKNLPAKLGASTRPNT